jgi:uncharacterized protein YndB with AHSA1/START domain
MSDTIDRPHRTISFERTLDATPEEVFDAWTEPAQVTRWWDPSGTPLVACTIDLRPGGGLRFVTAGHAPPFEGTYDVIDRPGRIEFTAMGAKGVVSLLAHGTGTRMTVSIASPSLEHFEMFLKLGVNVGTAATLDNLVGHMSLARRAGDAR